MDEMKGKAGAYILWTLRYRCRSPADIRSGDGHAGFVFTGCDQHKNAFLTVRTRTSAAAGGYMISHMRRA